MVLDHMVAQTGVYIHYRRKQERSRWKLHSILLPTLYDSDTELIEAYQRATWLLEGNGFEVSVETTDGVLLYPT